MDTIAQNILAYRSLPKQVAEAVQGLNDTQLDTPYRKGGWTVRQIVHHIGDSHLNAFIRMKLVIAEDYPTLKPYDQDHWAKLPDYNLPVRVSLGIIEGVQEKMATLFEHTQDADWQRSAYHPENGEMTLEDLFTMYARHGKAHVDQIMSLRKERGW